MSTAPLSTDSFRFLGANIKGTPAMSAQKVREDLKVLRSRTDLLVVQEFKWAWYWRQAASVLQQVLSRGEVVERWGISPGFAKGFKDSVAGAQACSWKRSAWKKIRTKVWLLHPSTPGISDDRYQRAVLLENRKTKQRVWIYTTHFAVGGDRKGAPSRNRQVLNLDISHMADALSYLRGTGHPVIGQLDANVNRTSEVYPRFEKVLDTHGARLHGEHGVEYLFTIDGTRTRVEVEKDWVVRTKEHGGVLNTDHEGRGITARLVAIPNPHRKAAA